MSEGTYCSHIRDRCRTTPPATPTPVSPTLHEPVEQKMNTSYGLSCAPVTCLAGLTTMRGLSSASSKTARVCAYTLSLRMPTERAARSISRYGAPDSEGEWEHAGWLVEVSHPPFVIFRDASRSRPADCFGRSGRDVEHDDGHSKGCGHCGTRQTCLRKRRMSGNLRSTTFLAHDSRPRVFGLFVTLKSCRWER